MRAWPDFLKDIRKDFPQWRPWFRQEFVLAQSSYKDSFDFVPAEHQAFG
jgi:hypothetical protein